MIYGSVCSGIEAATVAWKPLGWKAAFFSEIEKFPSAVLDHHYPDAPNLGDMTNFKEWPDYELDVLVGGTPCQSFSIAGLRKGLDDPRGNLMLTYLAIVARYRPKWLAWENVPGVLSSNGGRDFGTLLGGLGQLGYGFAYRVLDAQFVGVPQRRRRVFVVGHFGDWRSAAAVLFERHSLSGNPPPSRQKGETAPTIPSRSTAGGGLGTDFDCDGGLITNRIVPTLDANFGRLQGCSGQDANHGHGHLIAFGGNNTSGSIDVSTAVNAKGGSGRQDFETETFIAHPVLSFHGSQDPCFSDSVTNPLGRNQGLETCIAQPYTLAIRGRGDSHDLEYRQDGTANALLTPNGGRGGIGVGAVAFAQNQRNEVRTMNVAGALAAEPGMKQQTYVAQPGMQVRRLTPRECERLQGFPDDYTLIPGKSADGPRYKALGNSMAVPVMAWIGKRIDMVNSISEELQPLRKIA